MRLFVNNGGTNQEVNLLPFFTPKRLYTREMDFSTEIVDGGIWENGDAINKPSAIELTSTRTFKSIAEAKAWIDFWKFCVDNVIYFDSVFGTVQIQKGFMSWNYSNTYTRVQITIVLIPFTVNY
ncbi:MAG: hypothetical protein QXT97_02505 [Candidatus Diapherotrites archaeon]